MESLFSQVRAFIATIAAGAVVGFCYDCWRVARRSFKLKKTGTFLGDVLFWLVATVVVFLLLLWGNWGEVRSYVFLGLGLGAFTYFRFFSGAACRLVWFKIFLLRKTWEILAKLVSLLWSATLFPFRLVILILSYPLDFLRLILKKAGRKLRAVFYNLAGRRLEHGLALIQARLSRLAFWKKKKE